MENYFKSTASISKHIHMKPPLPLHLYKTTVFLKNIFWIQYFNPNLIINIDARVKKRIPKKKKKKKCRINS